MTTQQGQHSQEELKAVTKFRKRNTNTSHTAPPLHHNGIIEGIMGMLPDIKLSIRKPGGGTKLNAIVEVNHVRILKAVLSRG